MSNNVNFVSPAHSPTFSDQIISLYRQPNSSKKPQLSLPESPSSARNTSVSLPLISVEANPLEVIGPNGKVVTPKKKKVKKIKDPNAPKKPLTAFMLFTNYRRPMILKKNPCNLPF